MKKIIAYLLLTFVAVGQTTFNNLTVKTNLTFGQTLTAGTTAVSAAEVSYLDGVTNGIQGQINARFARASGLSTLYTLGDSIANGSAATTFGQAWPALFAASWGLTEQRLAYGSARIIDYYWQSCPPFIYTNSFAGNVATAPSSNLGSYVWAVGMGDYNGMRDYGTSAAYQAFSKAGFLSLGVHLAVTNKTLASSATASGTWVANTNLGGFLTTTNSASSLTFTNIVGDTLYVAYIVTATNDFGGVTVSVNGTNYGTFEATGGYGNRTWDNGSDVSIPTYISPDGNGKLWYMPRVVRIPLGMSSRHTVIVTASGATTTAPSGVLWVAGNGQRRMSVNTGPVVLFSGTLRQATYTGSGSNLAAGQFSGFIREVVDTLRSDGLMVFYVPSEQWFNEFTEMSGDNVHPSNTGHSTIANAFSDVFSTYQSPRASLSRAGALPSGVSIGQNPATSGDLRLPAASSIVWRNSSGTAGVSITNSGTALEIDAPNSSGSIIRSYLWRGDAFPMRSETYGTFTAGSPVAANQNATFGLSSGTAVLNQHVVTEAQSGTGGFAIHDTALTRSSSGSGEANIYRSQVGGRNIFRVTAGGRLLVDTATSGTGTSSRFGTGTDSSDTVLISYGTSAVNRELQIGAGAINMVLNDGTSTAVTLPIQSNGGGVIIGTAASGSGSGLYINQSASDRRMTFTGSSSIDVVLNSTGATGQALTINGSGGAVSFGASGTTNQSLAWSGGTGTDRRLQLGGNSIQVSLNSNGTSYQNLAIQASGGDLIVGSSSSSGIRFRASGGAAIFSGTGTPEAAVTAPIGSLFLRTDGGAGTTLYVKESGAGNTGWVGK